MKQNPVVPQCKPGLTFVSIDSCFSREMDAGERALIIVGDGTALVSSAGCKKMVVLAWDVGT